MSNTRKISKAMYTAAKSDALDLSGQSTWKSFVKVRTIMRRTKNVGYSIIDSGDDYDTQKLDGSAGIML